MFPNQNPQPPQQGFQQPQQQPPAYQQPQAQPQQPGYQQPQQPPQQAFQQPQQGYQPPQQQGYQQPQQQQGYQQQQAMNGPSVGAPPPGIFRGIESAEVNAGGAFFKEGSYVVRLGSWIWKQGRLANMVIIETDIIQSSYDPNTPATHNTNKPGTSASIYIKQNDSFLSNFKELIIAASGYGPDGTPRSFDDTVTQQECDAALGPNQPFAGSIVYIEALEITTKGGNPFTRLNFKPVRINADGSPDYSSI